jgi:hypothetical protein
VHVGEDFGVKYPRSVGGSPQRCVFPVGFCFLADRAPKRPPVEQACIHDFFAIGFDDFVANLVGYFPVGAVLAKLGTGTAIGLAFSVTVFAETM